MSSGENVDSKQQQQKSDSESTKIAAGATPDLNIITPASESEQKPLLTTTNGVKTDEGSSKAVVKRHVDSGLANTLKRDQQQMGVSLTLNHN